MADGRIAVLARIRKLAAVSHNTSRNRRANRRNLKKAYVSPRFAEAARRNGIEGAEKARKTKSRHTGVCQICGNPCRPVKDHCHRSGKRRGRICNRCNLGLGMFKDDTVLLRKALGYLESYIERFPRLK